MSARRAVAGKLLLLLLLGSSNSSNGHGRELPAVTQEPPKDDFCDAWTEETAEGAEASALLSNASKPCLATPGLRSHYLTWTKMILESDFVRDNLRNATAGGEGGGEEGDRQALISAIRERVLHQVVTSGQRKANPRPTRVSDECRCGLYNSPRSKIIGGTETYEHHYPWMVSIQLIKNSRKIPFCGGSIISDAYILTAAHCVEGLSPNQLEVRAGDHDLSAKDVSREQSLHIEEILVHPGYNEKSTDSDLALIRLGEPLTFTWRVNPICLTPHDLTYFREKVVVMGWGKVQESHKKGSPTLRHAVLEVLHMGKCRYNFKFLSTEITSNMLCAWQGTVDSCQGDSGGPLTWFDEVQKRYFLIGVTSWGIGCGLPEYPGVYTKVSKYVDWIYENTRDSVFCSSYSPKADRKIIRSKGKLNRKKKPKGRAGGKKKSFKRKNNGKKYRKGKLLENYGGGTRALRQNHRSRDAGREGYRKKKRKQGEKRERKGRKERRRRKQKRRKKLGKRERKMHNEIIRVNGPTAEDNKV